VPVVFDQLFRRVERHGLIWRALDGICALGTGVVAGWLGELRPDVVVSTYPLASECLGELRAAGRCAAPVLTYLTDPAVHDTWVHPAVDRHVTVTAATAAHGAAAYGAAMTAGGPLVPARFARPSTPGARAALRVELGLPDGPVALVVAGSLGIGDVLPAVRDTAAAGVRPLVLCGRNDGLRRRVAAVAGATALGWRTDVDRLMHLADVLVHNAGGLSFTEALVAGLPAVTYRAIAGHGRANAAVLDRSGLAPWAHDAAELAVLLHRQVAAGRRRAVWGDPTDAVLALLPGRARARAA
jgi:UDP-N-acetylglucosamine:LPS N-acetylglucosamine transferase